jgi:hypothetical protein
MYIEAELVTKAYLPDELELGMLFIRINFPGTDDSAIELFVLDKLPRDKDVFLKENGAPVELYVILTDERESFMEIIATPNQLAWIDLGDENLYIPELRFYNLVLNEYNGILEIEIDEEEEESLVPILVEGKAIIRELTEEITCDNCGSTDIVQNSSGDIMCESCGWEENEEEF